MRIEKITLYHVELPLKTPFVTGFGSVTARGSLLVKVEADGLAAWGEAPHLPLPTNLPEFMAAGKALLTNWILPAVLGKELSSPRQVTECWCHLKGNNISKSAVEMAVWDLLAKKQGAPLYKYLGAPRNTAETGVSIAIKSVPELLEDVARAVDDGYKRIKVKIKPGADVQVVRAIREHFPDVPLMVDANSSYTLNEIETLKQLDSYDLMMIEQPLAYDDLVDHATLQKQLDTPICLDESIRSAADVRKAADLGSCRIINIKPGRVGGIAESLEILALSRRYALGAWIGGMLESAVGKTTLAHVATAEGVNFPGDLNPGRAYLVEDIAPTPEPVNGIITLSDAPGIGVEVNQEILEKYLAEKIVIGR